MTGSAGMFGLANNVSYATAKAAVIGLTRSLTTAGATHDIKVNVIAPRPSRAWPARLLIRCRKRRCRPSCVAPMVAFLAHEDCPVSGEIYAAGAGRPTRVFIASTPGYVHAGGHPTIEDVAQNWATINDEAGYSTPVDLVDWSATFTAHLRSGTP